MSDIKTMNIHKKLAAISKMAGALQKNKKGFNYNYVSEDEVLAKVKAGMEKYGLMLYVGYVPNTLKTEFNTYIKKKMQKINGNLTPTEETVAEYIATAELEYEWVNIDNPSERIKKHWMLAGSQSDVSQAIGSGLTYMNRYFLLKFFQFATSNDDPDNWNSKKGKARDDDDSEEAAEIMNGANELITNFASGLKDGENEIFREKIGDIAKKYAKDKKGNPSMNFMAIKDVGVARKFIAEATEYIGTLEASK